MTNAEPTADDIAHAIADLFSSVPPAELIVHVQVRSQTASRYGHQSNGSPLLKFAAHLHAALYGLPINPTSKES